MKVQGPCQGPEVFNAYQHTKDMAAFVNVLSWSIKTNFSSFDVEFKLRPILFKFVPTYDSGCIFVRYMHQPERMYWVVTNSDLRTHRCDGLFGLKIKINGQRSCQAKTSRSNSLTRDLCNFLIPFTQNLKHMYTIVFNLSLLLKLY